MIKAGRAYVCHQTPEEMHLSRYGVRMLKHAGAVGVLMDTRPFSARC